MKIPSVHVIDLYMSLNGIKFQEKESSINLNNIKSGLTVYISVNQKGLTTREWVYKLR